MPSKATWRIFFRLKGLPPTTLAEIHFAKKPLTEMGGPPAPERNIANKNLKKWAQVSVFWPLKAFFSGFFPLRKISAK